MGDFALIEPEVKPVLQTIIQAGWKVTGMHNHMIQETPKLLFMHWRAHGTVESVVATIKQALSHTTILTSQPATTPAATNALDCNAIATKLGSKIAVPNGDVCDVVLVRTTPQIVDENGTALNIFTLMNSVLEFTPMPAAATATSALANNPTTSTTQNVMAMGDFALLESEVNPVLDVIVPANWTVTGFHNHMLQETPKLSFMHWTAQGDLNTIIDTANAALSKTTIPHGTTTTSISSVSGTTSAASAKTAATNATSTSSTNTSTSTTATVHVSIIKNAASQPAGTSPFQPNPVNIKVGTTVTWTNTDSTPHTITSGTGPSDSNQGKEFDSNILGPGQSFSHTFTTAGTFSYFCKIHPMMTGQVNVS
jgi:plastocyanin